MATGGTIVGITDLAIADGGTGASTATAALNNLLPSQASAANKYLQSDGTNASWDAISINTGDITGTLAVANGGTGVTSSTGTGSVVLSNSPTLVTPTLGAASASSLDVSGNVTLSGGTADTVPYLNGSKVLTSSTALYFNGTNLGVGGTSSYRLQVGSSTFDDAEVGVKITRGGDSNSWTLVDNVGGSGNYRHFNTGTPTARWLTTTNGSSFTEQMRLNPTGLGIKNNNPAAALDVTGSALVSGSVTAASFSGALNGTVGATTPAAGSFTTLGASSTATLNTLASSGATLTGGTINGMTIGATTASTGAFTTLSATGNVTLGDASTDTLNVGNGGLVKDASGNVGLGVTPSAWTNSFGVIQGLGGWSISHNGTNSNSVDFLSNAYRSGGTNTYLYTATSSATRYQQAAGVHAWYNAASGTAGNAITFTQAMTLDAAGDLGIGVTSPTAKLDVFKTSVDAVSRTNAVGAFGDFAGLGAGLLMQQTLSSPYGFALQASDASNTSRFPLLLNPSGGNVGIGTSSPSSYSLAPNLVVDTATSGGITIRGGTTGYGGLFFADGTAGDTQYRGFIQYNHSFSGSVDALVFGTAATNRMTLDTSGNLGLGVTPSAWTSFSVLQIGETGCIASNSFSSANTQTFFGNNVYYDGAYKYIATGSAAAQYFQIGSEHRWNIAASGTAGNAISFTQAMTLTAAGDLGIGTTNPSQKFVVSNAGAAGLEISPTAIGSSPAMIAYNRSGAAYLRFTTAALFHVWQNGSTEVARIDSDGNFLVGTTTNTFAATNGFVVNGPAGGTYAAVCHPTGTGSGASYMIFSYNGSLIGNITQSGTTAVLYNVTSDQRLKENIQDADSSSSLIDSLQVRKFDWKTDQTHQRYGFVAQELVTVAPEAVYQPEDTEQMMAVDYSKLVPMLVKEVQSLRQRVAQLETN